MFFYWSPYTLLFAFLAASTGFILVVALLVMWLNGRFPNIPLADDTIPPPQDENAPQQQPSSQNAEENTSPIPEIDPTSPLAYAAVAAQAAARREKGPAPLAAEGYLQAADEDIPEGLPPPDETLRPLPQGDGDTNKNDEPPEEATEPNAPPKPPRPRRTPTGLWQLLAAIGCGLAALLVFSVGENIYGTMRGFTAGTAINIVLFAAQIFLMAWLVRIQRRLQL